MDTAGTLTDDIMDIVRVTDATVVLVHPTPNDVESFTRTVSLVRKNTKAPMVIVVNGWNRFKMYASFMEWLEKKDWVTNVITVPQSEAIAQAQEEGRSAVKVDR